MNFGSRLCPTLLLTSAALGFLLLFCRPKAAVAQVPGGGPGNLENGGLPQPPTPTVSRTPPQRGEVFDLDALERTTSFCVDLSHMEGSEAADVKEFLAKESQPNMKLLGRLHWKLVDDCTKADAVARIYFAQVTVREARPAVKLDGRSASPQKGSQPVLLLYDKASVRLFYRAQGQVLHGKPVDVLGSPFSMLLKDLKEISR